MSVVVDLAELGEQLEYHDTAYLVLTGGPRPHVTSVPHRWVDGVLDLGPAGHTATRALADHPAVTVLLPPRTPGGPSLIVDGDASLVAGAVHVRPVHAVLHRSAS
jgi:hypothetical protein